MTILVKAGFSIVQFDQLYPDSENACSNLFINFYYPLSFIDTNGRLYKTEKHISLYRIYNLL